LAWFPARKLAHLSMAGGMTDGIESAESTSLKRIRVAVIGSFRQHYKAVCQCICDFRAAGWVVTSPAGTKVLKEGIDFVRFVSDDPALNDAEVQSITLRNIFLADLVYVVAPNGYVGCTTCYEIGRLIQARRPVYLSHHPQDLPVRAPDRFVIDTRGLIARLRTCDALECWYDHGDDELARIERDLTHGDLR
jgi:hypothetical protein